MHDQCSLCILLDLMLEACLAFGFQDLIPAWFSSTSLVTLSYSPFWLLLSSQTSSWRRPQDQVWCHYLDALNQPQGLKYSFYADNPRFVSLVQTNPLNSSLTHPALNSTLLGHLGACHTLHVPSQGLLTGVPPGQSHKAPECGFMLLV